MTTGRKAMEDGPPCHEQIEVWAFVESNGFTFVPLDPGKGIFVGRDLFDLDFYEVQVRASQVVTIRYDASRLEDSSSDDYDQFLALEANECDELFGTP